MLSQRTETAVFRRIGLPASFLKRRHHSAAAAERQHSTQHATQHNSHQAIRSPKRKELFMTKNQNPKPNSAGNGNEATAAPAGVNGQLVNGRAAADLAGRLKQISGLFQDALQFAMSIEHEKSLGDTEAQISLHLEPIKEEMNETFSRIAAIEAKYKRLNQQINKRNDEDSAMLGRLQHSQSQFEHMETRVKRLSSSFDTAASRIVAIEQEQTGLKADLEAMVTLKENGDERMATMESRIQTLRGDRASAERQMRELRESIEETAAKTESVLAAVDSLREGMQSLDGRLSGVQAAANHAHSGSLFSKLTAWLLGREK
jgi:archaellum component FlaC